MGEEPAQCVAQLGCRPSSLAEKLRGERAGQQRTEEVGCLVDGHPGCQLPLGGESCDDQTHQLPPAPGPVLERLGQSGGECPLSFHGTERVEQGRSQLQMKVEQCFQRIQCRRRQLHR